METRDNLLPLLLVLGGEGRERRDRLRWFIVELGMLFSCLCEGSHRRH